MKNTIRCSLFTIHSQKGSALVITLLIVTILISLTVEFAYEVYLDSSALSNWSNAQRASLIAKSGQTLGAAFVRNISFTNTYSEILLPVEKDFGDNTLLSIKIEDENAKFNINSIIYDNGKINDIPLYSLQKLFENLNINPSLALAIADWIDSDHEPKLKDSEFNAKNLRLWNIEELKLIEGIDEKTFEIIAPYIRVGDQSDKKININTAKLPVLMSLYTTLMNNDQLDMRVEIANKIINYRESAPFKEENDLQYIFGPADSLTPAHLSSGIDVKGLAFRVTSTATVNGITRVIESVVDKNTNVLFWREG